VGQLILAIDPQAFAGVDTSRIEDMAQAVEGEAGARLPGARRVTLRQDAYNNGITVDDDLIAQINAIGPSTQVQV
jgi:(2R)-3-sulfolactate dehydrogenase (NADP+)